MTSRFVDMGSSSNFFEVVLFLLSSLATGPSFMSISSLVPELWQFSFIRDWSEIRKLEIPPSEFCPISGDWGKLGIPNLARRSLMKGYWMLQNPRVTAFTISQLLGENQKGRRKLPWLFWKFNLMSDIYELKSQFCECNLRSNVVYFCLSFTLP